MMRRISQTWGCLLSDHVARICSCNCLKTLHRGHGSRPQSVWAQSAPIPAAACVKNKTSDQFQVWAQACWAQSAPIPAAASWKNKTSDQFWVWALKNKTSDHFWVWAQACEHKARLKSKTCEHCGASSMLPSKPSASPPVKVYLVGAFLMAGDPIACDHKVLQFLHLQAWNSWLETPKRVTTKCSNSCSCELEAQDVWPLLGQSDSIPAAASLNNQTSGVWALWGLKRASKQALRKPAC